MAAISSNGTTGNWTGANTAIWTGGVVPTAADDVTITSSSVLTIPASTNVVCRSLTINSGATLAFAATTSQLSIGDGTAGAGNVALSINSGATITLTAIGTINLISTSATQQTIATGGKTIPNLTINGAGSSYLLSDNLTSSGTITVTTGTFSTGNKTVSCSVLSSSNSNTRTISLGSSSITCTLAGEGLTLTTATNLTWSSNTATITFSGSNASMRSTLANFNGTNFTFTGGGAMTLNSGGANFTTTGTLRVTGTAVQTDTFSLGQTSNTVGSWVLNGNSAINRITVITNVVGTARTLTLDAAGTFKTGSNNFDLMDVTVAGGAANERDFSAVSAVGDRGGNSGVIFTTAATQTRDSTSGQAWSVAARWTSRVPLPQDDVVLNASSGSISSTDVLCLGKSIDMTNYAGTITQTTNASPFLLFGSVNLGGVTWGAVPDTFAVTLGGRSSHTITSNGKTFFPASATSHIQILAPGGTYTLTDAFTQYVQAGSGSGFLVNAGSFATNNYSMSIGRFLTQGSITRSVTMGTSNITLKLANSGQQAILLVTSGLTWSANSSSWTLSTQLASTSNRSLDMAGLSIGSFTYNVANSNSGLQISSSCIINNFTIGSGRSLVIAAGATLTSKNYTLTGTNNGYIYMPGDNYGASAPDSAALSITGDFDFRQRMSFDSVTPAGSMRIAGKYNATGNQRTWRLYLTNTGKLTLDMSTTGADSSVATCSVSLSSVGLSADVNYWIRFTREKSTGSVKFYYAADNTSMPSSWTQIGTTQTGTTAALYDSTALLTVGGEVGGTNSNPGRYYWSQLRNNILDDGTGIQFDAVFSSKTVGADTFTEASSNAATVTMNGLSLYGDGRLQIVSSSAGAKAFLSKPSGGAITGVDYLKIQDIHMVQPLAFYVGANSTLVSNTSGIYIASTTYTHKQSAAGTFVSATSTSVTFPTATTAGNLLVAYIESGGSTGGGESYPSGWTLAKSSSASGVGYIFYKIADGTETTVTYSQTNSRGLSIAVVEYAGFSGTPTLDVTDSFGSGGATNTLSTTATTGPTNTAQPALALAWVGGVSTLGSFISATNNFIQDYTYTNASGTYTHAVVKELTSLATVETTLTWTTSRANVYTGLVVFKNVSNFIPKVTMIM